MNPHLRKLIPELSEEIYSEESSSVEDFLTEPQVYKVKYLVFRPGNRPYGGGGWSRRARYRPLPEVVSVEASDVRFSGKKVWINGVPRLKCNIWILGQPHTPLWLDYPNIPYED